MSWPFEYHGEGLCGGDWRCHYCERTLNEGHTQSCWAFKAAFLIRPGEAPPDQGKAGPICGITGMPFDDAKSILQQAQETISERGEQYGDAKEVFDTTAAMFNAWNAVWSGDGEFGATGVAVFNICQKLARIAHGESDIDNWRDIIGYAALGAEIEE